MKEPSRTIEGRASVYIDNVGKILGVNWFREDEPLAAPLSKLNIDAASREYHKRVTACDDVWDSLDASERETWYDDTRAIVDAAIRQAVGGA